MNLEKIDYKSLLKHLYDYKKLDFEIKENEVFVKILKEYPYQIFIEDVFNNNILKNIHEKDFELTILKHLTDKHITSNPLILDLIVNGANTYYLNWSNNFDKLTMTRMSDFSTRFGFASKIMEEEERHTLTDIEFNELINCGKNIIEKLEIKGFPINFLRKEYDKINVLENIIYKDTPEFYLKEDSNRLDSIAIIKYENALNEVSKSFWRKILEQEHMLEKLNNPLLKEKDKDLKLYQYHLTGECYKGDGYETWKSKIDHYYISNTPLNESKMKTLYEYEAYELRDILYINIERMRDNDTSFRNYDSCQFVKIINDGLNAYNSEQYVSFNSNNRFKYLNEDIVIENKFEIEEQEEDFTFN